MIEISQIPEKEVQNNIRVGFAIENLFKVGSLFTPHHYYLHDNNYQFLFISESRSDPVSRSGVRVRVLLE